MPEIKDHKFTENSPDSAKNIDILESIATRFCEQMEDVVADFLSVESSVEHKNVERKNFGDWIGSLESFESISTYRLMPLKGSLLVHLNAQMVAAFVDIYFGGDLGKNSIRNKPVFKEIEQTIIDRFCVALLENLGSCFAEETSFEPILMSHEANPSYVKSFKFKEQVACQTILIKIDKISWPISIVYGGEAIKSAGEISPDQSQGKPAGSDPVWQRQWERNLTKVHLPLRTVIAQPVMTLPQLFELKVDDIIPVMVKSKPPLFVANRKFAVGTLGERDGCSAYKIEKIETGELA